MRYRIRIDLAFPTEAPHLALLNHALGFFPKAVTINPGDINEEVGFITTEKCYHDEEPGRPCEIIEELTTQD